MRKFMDALSATHFAMSDGLRLAQADALDMLGLGPHETDFQVVSSGPHWRLRSTWPPRETRCGARCCGCGLLVSARSCHGRSGYPAISFMRVGGGPWWRSATCLGGLP